MNSVRVVHCKREKHDIYIGRPSKWGNPFPVPMGYDRGADPDRILDRYEAYVRSRPELMAALPELRGKVLGCWCAPHRCHGDVLAKLVAETEPRALVKRRVEVSRRGSVFTIQLIGGPLGDRKVEASLELNAEEANYAFDFLGAVLDRTAGLPKDRKMPPPPKEQG